MTGYTVHTGTSKKFVNGWDRIFVGSPGEEKPADTSKTKKNRKKKKPKKKS